MFIPLLYLAPSQGRHRRNFVNMFDTHKTRMTVLSSGEETMTKCWLVSTEYRNVTGRVADGRTDS